MICGYLGADDNRCAAAKSKAVRMNTAGVLSRYCSTRLRPLAGEIRFKTDKFEADVMSSDVRCR